MTAPNSSRCDILVFPRLTKQCEKETHPPNLFRKYPSFPYNKKIKQKATTSRHSTLYPCGIIMPDYVDDADSVNLKRENCQTKLLESELLLLLLFKIMLMRLQLNKNVC